MVNMFDMLLMRFSPLPGYSLDRHSQQPPIPRVKDPGKIFIIEKAAFIRAKRIVPFSYSFPPKARRVERPLSNFSRTLRDYVLSPIEH